MTPRPPRKAGGGFTLVELVAVIVLMGILAAVAVPRFLDRGSHDARGFRDAAAALLRYAHKLAIGRHGMVYVQWHDGALGLCAAATLPCPADLPGPGGETPYRAVPPGGIAITASLAVLGFNARGQPTDAGAGPLAAAATYSITGDIPLTLTVEAETGYVH